jgi:hypothetical protein
MVLSAIYLYLAACWQVPRRLGLVLMYQVEQKWLKLKCGVVCKASHTGSFALATCALRVSTGEYAGVSDSL